MKMEYPVILTQGKKYAVVNIPDFRINTQGVDVPDALRMAQDAIGLVGIDMQDDGEALPAPTPVAELKIDQRTETVAQVEVDFDAYRKQLARELISINPPVRAPKRPVHPV